MEDFEVFNLGCPNCDELAIDKLLWVGISDLIACQTCGMSYQFGTDSITIQHNLPPRNLTESL